jgi:hypothetical protein
MAPMLGVRRLAPSAGRRAISRGRRRDDRGAVPSTGTVRLLPFLAGWSPPLDFSPLTLTSGTTSAGHVWRSLRREASISPTPSFVDLNRRGGRDTSAPLRDLADCAMRSSRIRRRFARRGVTSSPSCAASRSCALSSSRRTSSSILTSSPFCPPSHDETGDAVQSRIELHCTSITTAQRKKSESCQRLRARARRRMTRQSRVSSASREAAAVVVAGALLNSDDDADISMK